MTRPCDQAAEFEIAVGSYVLTCVPDGLPAIFNSYEEHGALLDDIALNEPNLCCVAVRRVTEPWPFLVVAQGFSPAGGGFNPGILLVPETNMLFVGAGERLLAYDLATPRRLWEDRADTGFLGWAQHNDVVVLSAELEMAAWTTAGKKLWSTFAEPPWEYKVDGDMVDLDVMEAKSRFPLRLGPAGALKDG